MQMTETTKKWIEALRSGRYNQCYGNLKKWMHDIDAYGYCCLGVGEFEVCGTVPVFDVDDSWGVLPLNDNVELEPLRDGPVHDSAPQLQNATGMTSCEQIALINMNDQLQPFSYIAHQIERMVEVSETTGYACSICEGQDVLCSL